MPRIKGIKKDKVGNYNNEEKKNLLLKSLSDFYSDNYDALRDIHQIIDGKSTPLRLIEYFITNYSKTNNIVYKVKINENDLLFCVHNEYKNQLKSYTKKLFDPFKRDDRIDFKYYRGEEICIINTTIGQLNFFRWIIKYEILNYINDNYEKIEGDMNKYCTKKKKEAELKKLNKNKKPGLKTMFSTSSNGSNSQERTINTTVSFD